MLQNTAVTAYYRTTATATGTAQAAIAAAASIYHSSYAFVVVAVHTGTRYHGMRTMIIPVSYVPVKYQNVLVYTPYWLGLLPTRATKRTC